MDLVFVHFNTKLPRHLELNLERSQHLFPTRNVHLVTDQQTNHLSDKRLQIHHIRQDYRWQQLNTSLNHPKEFRGNFWLTSIARFLALQDFAEFHVESFLHVESDVIISSDFPFDIVNRLKYDIAFPIVSNSQAIASTLFIRNHSAASQLARFSLECARADSSTTDMFVLHKFLLEFPEIATILPSAFSFSQSIDSLNLCKRVREEENYFQAAFDGFDFGRFLFGDDPRNKRGFSTLRKKDPNSFLDVSKLNLVSTVERAFPSVRDGVTGGLIPLQSLHIHSKNLSLFRIKKTDEQIRRAVADSNLPPKRIFIVRVFIKSLVQAIRRRVKKAARA